MGEVWSEDLFIMSLRTGIKSFVVENLKTVVSVVIHITGTFYYLVILSECEESHNIEKVMRYFG